MHSWCVAGRLCEGGCYGRACGYVVRPSFQADTWNNLIRYVNVSTAEVTTLAGDRDGNTGSSDGWGRTASFFRPSGVAVDSFAFSAIVADLVRQQEWG